MASIIDAQRDSKPAQWKTTGALLATNIRQSSWARSGASPAATCVFLHPPPCPLPASLTVDALPSGRSSSWTTTANVCSIMSLTKTPSSTRTSRVCAASSQRRRPPLTDSDIEQIFDRRQTNRDVDAIYLLTPQPHIVDCVMADFEKRKYRRAHLVWTSCELNSPHGWAHRAHGRR